MSNTILAELVAQGYDPILSLQQVEVLTNLNKRTLQRLDDEGALKILRLSARRCGIRRSELQRFLESRETADATREMQAKPSGRGRSGARRGAGRQPDPAMEAVGAELLSRAAAAGLTKAA